MVKKSAIAPAAAIPGASVGISGTFAAPAGGKDACKNDGWRTVRKADGTASKNQGDCVSCVNHGGQFWSDTSGTGTSIVWGD
jgi:hypothetical protein